MSSEVRRASHVQKVPQVGLPQIAPVARAMAVISAPYGAAARAKKAARRLRQTKNTSAAAASITYTLIDSIAAGTWT